MAKKEAMNMKVFFETLESGQPEVINAVTEWLNSRLTEKPQRGDEIIECPFCARDISI